MKSGVVNCRLEKDWTEIQSKFNHKICSITYLPLLLSVILSEVCFSYVFEFEKINLSSYLEMETILKHYNSILSVMINGRITILTFHSILIIFWLFYYFWHIFFFVVVVSIKKKSSTFFQVHFCRNSFQIRNQPDESKNVGMSSKVNLIPFNFHTNSAFFT